MFKVYSSDDHEQTVRCFRIIFEFLLEIQSASYTRPDYQRSEKATTGRLYLLSIVTLFRDMKFQNDATEPKSAQLTSALIN